MLSMLYANADGTIYDLPTVHPAGMSGGHTLPLSEQDFIVLPPGSDLCFLPGRLATGYDAQGQPVVFGEESARLATAALLPAGYTRTHLPAFAKMDGAPVLPLFGYTAVAMKDGVYMAAAVQTDDNRHWDPYRYNTRGLKGKVRALRRRFPHNRLVKHLAHCSLAYHCCTAQNLFYHRWEAGIPTSPVCNANCLGCISLQPSQCCPSPQERIRFVPTVQEIAEIGLLHLRDAMEPIISFGQGCEGEPSLQAKTIAAAIEEIRSVTDRGIININTNAGFTSGIEELCRAGLDSMRVSLISARRPVYDAYYRAGYSLPNVIKSIKLAKVHGVYVSLNLLVFPGVTDTEQEVQALDEFLDTTHVDMVQLRNLNLDPEIFLHTIPPLDGPEIGIRGFISHLQDRHPGLVVGSFTHYRS